MIRTSGPREVTGVRLRPEEHIQQVPQFIITISLVLHNLCLSHCYLLFG